jgi:hypothetical protein
LNTGSKGGKTFIEEYNITCQDTTLDFVKEWVANDPGDVDYVVSSIMCEEDEFQEDDDPRYSNYREHMAMDIFDAIISTRKQ